MAEIKNNLDVFNAVKKQTNKTVIEKLPETLFTTRERRRLKNRRYWHINQSETYNH